MLLTRVFNRNDYNRRMSFLQEAIEDCSCDLTDFKTALNLLDDKIMKMLDLPENLETSVKYQKALLSREVLEDKIVKYKDRLAELLLEQKDFKETYHDYR